MRSGKFSRWTRAHYRMQTTGVKIAALTVLACLSVVALAGAADPTPIATATPALPATPPPTAGPCGPYPKLYKEIVWNWMQKSLVDPDSAKVEWQNEPTCTDVGKGGQHEYGWLINFTVNSRNRFGTYTGKQQHGVLIRNGEVVKGIGFGY